jgi:uncharacterized membrane protein
MTETQNRPSQNPDIQILEDGIIRQKKIVLLVYGSFLISSILFSFYTSFFAIVGVMVAHIKISESSSFIHSHFNNQIYTFWIGFSFISITRIAWKVSMLLVSVPDDDNFYGLEGQEKIDAMSNRLAELEISISKMEIINTIGYTLTYVALIWVVYRCVKGILRIIENKIF